MRKLYFLKEIFSPLMNPKITKFLFLSFLLIISFYGFSQSRTVSPTTKKIVYARDGGKCKCCTSSIDLEYDHIVPYSCGGSSDASNIQLLCMRCNRSKSNSCYCKIHNKKVGINCCDGKTTNKQPSTSTQCTGTTKKGARCKNRTTKSNGRCHLHQ
ncbi:MAG: HNH endonuclease [Bacteroidetes bacterium]|nr:HNH endonuclease [Bacteroidota bacterium]